MRFKHNDIDIDVLDNGTFKAKVNGVDITAPSLIAMKNKINRTAPFEPFDGFFINYGDQVMDVRVIGIQKERNRAAFVWKTQCGRQLSYVYLDNPKTRAAVKKYTQAVEKHTKMKAEFEKIEEKLKEEIGNEISPEAPV